MFTKLIAFFAHKNDVYSVPARIGMNEALGNYERDPQLYLLKDKTLLMFFC